MRSRFYGRWWFFLDWPLTLILWLCVAAFLIAAYLVSGV